MQSLHCQSELTVLDRTWQMHKLVTIAEHMQLSSLFLSPKCRMQQCYQIGDGQGHLQLAKQLSTALILLLQVSCRRVQAKNLEHATLTEEHGNH